MSTAHGVLGEWLLLMLFEGLLLMDVQGELAALANSHGCVG